MALQKMSDPIYLPHVIADPWKVGAMTVSSWYDNETTTIYDPEQIPWLNLQGWYVDSTDETVDVRGVKSYTYRMRRRVIDPENALQTLINAQTSAFNEGRQLNDKRYDDIVAVYASVLDKTETELNSLNTDDSAYETLINQILASMDSDYTNYAAAVDAEADGFGTSELLRINTAFDARLATAKIELMNRGMYNSTIWTDTSAGIERERQVAITDLNDKISDRTLSIEDRKMKFRTDIRVSILAARDRFHSYLSKSGEVHTAIRNKVVEAMLGFMERREDSYPSINNIASVASELGAGSVNHPGG